MERNLVVNAMPAGEEAKAPGSAIATSVVRIGMRMRRDALASSEPSLRLFAVTGN